MDPFTSTLEFDVIVNDEKTFQEAIFAYNETYNTDFTIVNFIYDEVTFATIKVTRYKPSDLFDLGWFYHSVVTGKGKYSN